MNSNPCAAGIPVAIPVTYEYTLQLNTHTYIAGPLLLWPCGHRGNPNVGFNIVTMSYVKNANITLYIKMKP